MTTDEATWRAIRERWELGETAYRLAQIYAPTSQGIDQRAKREGWKREEPADTNTDQPVRENWFHIAEHEFKEPRGEKDNPETRGRVLSDIARGLPKGAACSGAGITAETWNKWLKADEDLNALYERARAAFVRRHAVKVNDEGDAGISLKVLERHSLTREEWSAPVVQSPNQGLNLAIVDGRELARRIAFMLGGVTIEHEGTPDVVGAIEDGSQTCEDGG